MKTLKAESYEAFFSACEAAGLIEDGEIIKHSEAYSIDAYGDHYHKTGSMLIDDDGNEYPEVELADGFHFNTIGDLTVLGEFEIDVETPSRKFSN